jgi:hypothetical protein
MSRFVRQILVPGVGEEGQRRIEAARARVIAGEVAVLYATRAGFASVEAVEGDRDALAPPEIVNDEASRDVLAGARSALLAIRAAIGGEIA